MEFGQKFGAGLLMGIPAFVGAGLWYDIFHSFIPVIIWLILMPPLYWLIIKE